MNKLIIYKYIDRIRKIDIMNYGIKEGIELNDEEINLIYFYIKNRYMDFFNNPDDIFREIEGNVRDNVYSKIIELYNKYKRYIG
ncbi:MAG: hypothetical protein SOZ11_00565 [Bacilli bacterium]|nr:hypothetical protein [bacterium]MDY3934024.1 hypothetical protein [Bacilli bacterium]